ncbi:hypothetical protein HBA43_08015 [Providencia rettgeri]|uniref:hypothetical protein n=1 Tax=Providencia TaxID=586 RepID=UPI0005B38585|nr:MULTISPECIES: hypothetical protein [Providencia]HCI96222.1 hypothetical protein [Providencia sp.]APC12503.1 hypothetical protein RB151_028440 [Providencia rettgeri]AVL75926.1 hypothetical protein CEQ08_20315 [Providencia rettgeri]EIU7557224.1 hypothetical protein [Providencia rettgeri]EJD6043654.1 hypothetical protein [Providencia rettgeri]
MKRILAVVLFICFQSSVMATTYSLDELQAMLDNNKKPEVVSPYKQLIKVKGLGDFKSCKEWQKEQLIPYAVYPQKIGASMEKLYSIRVLMEDRTLTFNCIDLDNVSGTINEAMYK